MSTARLMLAMLVVAALGVGLTRTAVAQESSEGIDYAQLEGLEQVVGRVYTVDFATIMASPDASGEIDYPDGIITAYAVVAKFDNAENAEAGWEVIRTEFRDQADETLQVEDSEIEDLDVGDLAENAAGYGAVVEDMGASFDGAVLLLREGDYVYVTITITNGTESTDIATELSESMIDADAGDGEGEENEAGIYSGGLWDKFPGEDDELVDGLTISDSKIFPEGDATDQ